MSSRRSPAAPPPDDDDLLSEILLRLPPDPSSLPRASLICKRWRRLISDPRFFRRFRAHHRRSPPLLGFLGMDLHGLSFKPTLEPSNRVPHGRFSLQLDDGDLSTLIGCRHGLVLMLDPMRLKFLVWDPVTGDQNRLVLPPGFDIMKKNQVSGAVLRAAGDVHFQVVLIGIDIQQTQALACIYSSEAGGWGNLISTPLPTFSVVTFPPMIYMGVPSVLVGDSLYWLLGGGSNSILEFDLDRQNLAVIPAPVDLYPKWKYYFTVMRAEGGGLGFFLLSDCTAQFWKRKTDCNGVALWVMGRTIELNKLLSLNPEQRESPIMLGFAEDNNMVFLWTSISFFMVELGSLKFKKLFETDFLPCSYSFESVYAAGI